MPGKAEIKKMTLFRLEFVLCDASLLLPPTGTPLTGIEFTKRLPCGEVERARHSIRTFFRLRQLSLEVQSKPETQLPLSNPDSCIQIQDVLDLSKSFYWFKPSFTKSFTTRKYWAPCALFTTRRYYLTLDERLQYSWGILGTYFVYFRSSERNFYTAKVWTFTGFEPGSLE